MVDDLISQFLPVGVMDFIVPGVAGGIVCVILIREFLKVTMNVDILEGLFG